MNMAVINHMLRLYSDWHQKMDAFIHLVPEDYRYVIDWRAEAEQKMIASGRAGMSDQAIRDYAAKFLPAYRLYGPRFGEGLANSAAILSRCASPPDNVVAGCPSVR